MSESEIEDWVTRASKEFYELIYRDEWLKEVFKIVPQVFITSQQIDFMLQALTSIKRYNGRNPGDAHPHIFVNEDMWQLRESYLEKAFERVGVPLELRERWLKIDRAFKAKIVMSDPAQCRRRFTTDELVIVQDLRKRVA